MRIAILALPLNTNYGGILQAWALQTVLERMGHEVWVIHKNPYFKEPSLWEYLCRYYKKKVLGQQLFVKAEEWHNQVTHILLKNTGAFIGKYIHCYTIDSLRQVKEKDFDAIVVGSDQIWRPEYFVSSWKTVAEDSFLGFAEDWGIKRISYAASFGTDEWGFSEKCSSDISRLIKKFSAVSVRERSGVEICKKHLNVEAQHLVDPTMLLNSEDYRELVKDCDLPTQSNSLFCYILDDNQEKQDVINKVAAARGLTPRQLHFPTVYADATQCWPVPPVEHFIQGMMDAEFVVTDSFHGCVFSIIFGKPFVAIVNKDRGAARMESLMQMFNLKDHLISDISQYHPEMSYATCEIDDALKCRRQEAMDYLKKYLPC